MSDDIFAPAKVLVCKHRKNAYHFMTIILQFHVSKSSLNICTAGVYMLGQDILSLFEHRRIPDFKIQIIHLIQSGDTF